MKNNWKYLDFSDLVSWQIEETRLSYDTHSHEYAEDWEWNKKIIDITRRDYIDPFMKLIARKGVVFVVGCGTGRDLKVLGESGYNYLGIDSSAGMLREAIDRRGVNGPVVCADLETINLVNNSFDGVLIDSAIEHVRKSDIKVVLEKLYKCLKTGGIVFLRFRVGDGRVFEVKDSVGTRYFTSYTEKEAEDFVTSNGFSVANSYITDHMDNSRPGFLTYILRK